MKALIIKDGEGEYSWYSEWVVAVHLVPDDFTAIDLDASYKLYKEYFEKAKAEFMKDDDNCVKYVKDRYISGKKKRHTHTPKRLRDSILKELCKTFSFSNFLETEMKYKKIEFMEAD